MKYGDSRACLSCHETSGADEDYQKVIWNEENELLLYNISNGVLAMLGFELKTVKQDFSFSMMDMMMK